VISQATLFDETLPALPPIHVNKTVHLAEAPRLSRQCKLILERLQEGRASNSELAQRALKYTGRISDLRAAGYVIEVVERNRDTGLTWYELK
jgi:hypothetical protein